MKLRKHLMLVGIGIIFLPYLVTAQAADDGGTPLSLEECLNYALENSPMIRQSQLDEQIGERQIKSSLSGWLPQISANFNAAHNIKLQTQVIGGNLITFGQNYNSNLQLQVNQTLFGRDQFFASKSADVVREQLDQSLLNSQINTVVAVSKAYYDILLTYEQIKILDENLNRVDKQFRDAKSRYESGVVDKTDYQRASISLLNLKSDKNRVQNSLKAKYAYMKQLMGYPSTESLEFDFDYSQMEAEMDVDSQTDLQYENRIEYKLMQSQMAVSDLRTQYEKWAFIPTISAYYNHNWIFFNNQFKELYQQSYPTSAVGLSFGIPIFQGTKRTQQIRIAELNQEKNLVQMDNLKKQINTEYEAALADYESSYVEWQNIKQNMEMAKEVYNIIKLQYDEGIKAYVDLIMAETELRTAQLNHYNALYKVMSSKLDLQKALGNIEINSTSK